MEAEPLRTRLLHLLRSGGYRPLNKAELARRLALAPDERAELRAELARLEREGVIVSGSRGRYATATASGAQLLGWLHFHRKGHAWLIPDRGAPENARFDLDALDRLFVPRRDTGTALEGDRVAARLVERGRPGRLRRGRPPDDEPALTARVERVLERRSGRLVGTFQQHGRRQWVEVDEPAFQGVVELAADTTARPGQAVVVELDQWPARHLSPRGRVTEVLGWPGEPGAAVAAVIHRHGLATGFPAEVLAEARAAAVPPPAAEVARRDDWRGRPVLTIDPGDAKDHDDAILVERTAAGWRLAVHIADVSHYVRPGTGLDREAAARGNSTYLVDRVLPMLPPELSSGICSLKPGADRLTVAVTMEVDARGTVTPARFAAAVIRSAARLDYVQAQAMLDGAPEPAGVPAGTGAMLREAWRLAGLLRGRRFAAGALDLEMPEVKVLLDRDGRPSGVEPVGHGPSHQLIEEFMLAANGAVARLLKDRLQPAVYRVHEEPDAGRLLEFAATARGYGYEPGDLTNRRHVQQLLDAARGRPDEHAIKLGLLKSLKRAGYATDPLGHYGLAVADYCHFTSPIRRYADLLVHRALQPLLADPPAAPGPAPAQRRLAELASHLSETERSSAAAEEETRRLMLLEFLEGLAGRRGEPVVFDGVVVDLRPAGLVVEATLLGLRGLVRREDLPGGRWRCEAHRGRFVRPDGRALRLGDRLGLVVARVDRHRGFVDFRCGPDCGA